jgi:hypothetical protein
VHPVLTKTFGGLTKQYYLRQLFFGSLFFLGFILFFSSMPDTANKSGNFAKYIVYFLLAVNTFLYPYSRFVYESVAGFILGNNVVITGFGFMMIMKYLTMGFCWAAAVFIAPIGLIYLYFHHSKLE